MIQSPGYFKFLTASLAWLPVVAAWCCCGCANLRERVAERIEYILPAQSAAAGTMVPFNFNLPLEANPPRVSFLNRQYRVFPRPDLQGRIYTAFLSIPLATPPGEYPILCFATVRGAQGKVEESFEFQVQPAAEVPGLERIAARGFDLKAYQAEYAQILKALQQANYPADRPPIFMLPQSGRLTALFGSRRQYNRRDEIRLLGVEIEPVAHGLRDVSAAADGKVLLACNLPMLGNTVVIDHGLAFATLYAHLAQPGVAEGQVVKRGQMLGKVGKSGKAAVGTRLLYQIFIEGVEMNPLKYTETNVFQKGERLAN